MELQRLSVLFLALFLLFLSFSSKTNAFKECPRCGSTRVPYPLSTEPHCGEPSYKIRCNGGTLWFDALNGSISPIKSINPITQRLIICPPGFESNACVAADYGSEGIQLDPSLPFNVTGSNSVMVMNCTKDGMDLYASSGFDCSDSSVCHKFMRENLEARVGCQNVSPCCWFKTGGSINAYKVYRAKQGRCSAYQSYVNLDPSLPVSKWGEPAVEIEWALPREPACKLPEDCQGLVFRTGRMLLRV